MKSVAVLPRTVYQLCTASLLVVSIAFSIGSASAQAAKSGQKIRLSFVAPGGGHDPHPLIAYLEKETGATIEMAATKNTEEAVEGMVKHEVDISYFGGLEFVQASARAGAKPLVQREEDQIPQCAFITQPDSNIHSLTDLSGHSFAFAVVTSVSSHVMPEYYLREAKVDPKVMEKAVFMERDAQVIAVANRKIDAAVVNPRRLQIMLKEGKVTDAQVRVFWTSPSFVDSVWAARGDFDPKLAQSFASAFLKLDSGNPEHKPVLALLQAAKYVRASDSSYDNLRKGAQAAGLVK